MPTLETAQEVMRTDFRIIRPGNYPEGMVCHACREPMRAGIGYCYLFNATDDGGNYWGECCAHVFPIHPAYA